MNERKKSKLKNPRNKMEQKRSPMIHKRIWGGVGSPVCSIGNHNADLGGSEGAPERSKRKSTGKGTNNT